MDCLFITFSAGGHGHLEQPVQHWISHASCVCINLPACKFEKDWNKNLMMASSFSELQVLGGICSHTKGTHQDVGGVKDESGAYISRHTAEYPAALASQFAQLIFPLLSHKGTDLTVEMAARSIPLKPFGVPPYPRHDGGGLHSHADWSSPPPHVADTFKEFRSQAFEFLLDQKRFQKVHSAFQQQQSDPPFSASEVASFRNIISRFFGSTRTHSQLVHSTGPTDPFHRTNWPCFE